jgi:hyperosmotically inducible periplasmic protein
MSKGRVTAWVLMVLFGLPLGAAAENASPKETQKEPEQSPPAEPKKKAETKPEAKPAEEKPSTEPPTSEPKKQAEPDRKPDSKPAAPEKPATEPVEPKKKTETEGKPPEERQPEPPAPAHPKKKTETEQKPDSKSQEEKPATEAPAPPPKVQEPAKKPVTSLNLTIKLALMAEPALLPLEIEVEVDKQKVTLTGAVASEEDKVKAGQIAKALEGVESVVNKLTVDASVHSAWVKKQDEIIAQLVKDRLSRSETLKAVGFEVKSEQGVVSLSGKTHYQVIALEAAEAARQVPGVRAVKTAGVQLTGKD